MSKTKEWNIDDLMRIQKWAIRHYFPLQNPHPIKIDYKMTRYLATAGQPLLKFSYDFISYTTLQSIRKTMIHELMHYEMGRLTKKLLTEKYKGDELKAWKDVEYRKLCGTHNREFQKRLHKISPQHGTWKYTYMCSCGNRIRTVKKYPKNRWICRYCGKIVKGVKNF